MTVSAQSIRIPKGKVMVTALEDGSGKTKGGIILNADDGKTHGIRPRWCKVYGVGEGVDDLEAGDWILVKHGRWTKGLTVEIAGEEITVWVVEYPSSVELKTKENPTLIKI